MIELRCIRSRGPMRHLAHSGCVRQSGVPRILCLTVSFVPLSSTISSHTSSCIVDASDVVHAAYDEICAVGRPCEVVNLGAAGPAHVLRPPCLLVFQAVGAEGGGVEVVLGWNPENDIAVVAGRSQELAWKVQYMSAPGRPGPKSARGVVVDIPLGAQRTTLTACVCLERVDRYSTLLSSPSPSIFQG